MILGYTIGGPDNGASMFKTIKLGDCDKFKNVYDLNIVDPSLKIPKKIYDLSASYDGYDIVSDKFRRFCERENYEGVEFVSLPSCSGFYWIKIKNIVEFDAEARKTRFLNYSEKCGGFGDVIGANPACLKKKEVLLDGFYRTNLFFGSGERKSPLIIVGIETAKKLKNENFNGLYFEEVRDTIYKLNT